MSESDDRARITELMRAAVAYEDLAHEMLERIRAGEATPRERYAAAALGIAPALATPESTTTGAGE